MPVLLGTTAAPGTHVPGNSQQSARNVVAEAAQHKQDRQMAARINQAVLRPGFLCRAAPPTLPLAKNPLPPPEPAMAPNQAGCLPAILAIFTAAWSLLSPRQTR